MICKFNSKNLNVTILEVINFFRDSCRFLWKRIPNPVARKKDVTLQAVWAIGKCLWSRNNEGTFAAISAFRSTNQGPSTLSTLVDILYGKSFLKIEVGLFNSNLF